MSGLNAIYSTFAKTQINMRQKLVSLTPVCLKYRETVVACAQDTKRSLSVHHSYRNYHTLSLRNCHSTKAADLSLRVSIFAAFFWLDLDFC